MKSKSNNQFFIYFIYAIVLAGIGGWCANVYKIVSTGFEFAQWGGLEIGRVIGVFVAPLGAILGFV